MFTLQGKFLLVMFCSVICSWMILLRYKQDSFVTGFLSAASAAYCSALRALYLLSAVPMGISLPPYCTYMQRFDFRSNVFPEIWVPNFFTSDFVATLIMKSWPLPPSKQDGNSLPPRCVHSFSFRSFVFSWNIALRKRIINEKAWKSSAWWPPVGWVRRWCCSYRMLLTC